MMKTLIWVTFPFFVVGSGRCIMSLFLVRQCSFEYSFSKVDDTVMFVAFWFRLLLNTRGLNL